MKTAGLRFAVLILAVAPCLAQYKFTKVDFPGAAQTEVIAMNNKRQFVGASIDGDPAMTNHAIYFDGKTLSLLDPTGVVGTNYSFALSLNLRGDIVGGYFDASGAAHGFLYNGGNVTTIDYPGAGGTFAFGVNDKREVIGVYADSAGIQHSFLLHNGVYKNIDVPGGAGNTPTTSFSINDASEVVGEFVNVAGTTGHGYFQTRKGEFATYDAPAAPPNSTLFISINNLDQILGTWFDTSIPAKAHNFLLTFGKSQNFNVPKSYDAAQVSAQTLNDLGDIVGFYTDQQGIQHGFAALRN